MILIILAWDRLFMSWAGKYFRPKAAFSIFVPLKATVKVNLPISMLYDEVCRWTTATRSTCGFILTSENQGRSKVHGNHDHMDMHMELSPLEQGADNSKDKYIKIVERIV